MLKTKINALPVKYDNVGLSYCHSQYFVICDEKLTTAQFELDQSYDCRKILHHRCFKYWEQN